MATLKVGGKSRIFGLDLMRAAAITMVLAGHCAWIIPAGDTILHQLMAFSGYLGVEVFFVLSGFLIGRILLDLYAEPFTFKSVFGFLQRRWFRTLPTYYLVLIINIGIAMFIGYEIVDAWRYFAFMQNFSDAMLPFFTESWSLSVEESAYVILPFALLLGTGFTKGVTQNQLFISVVVLLYLLIFSNRVIYHLNTPVSSMNHWNLSLKSVVIYRLDAIFTGVIASWIFYNYPRQLHRLKTVALSAGIAMLLFMMFGLGALNLFIEHNVFFWNVLYLPMTSVAVAMFLPYLAEWKNAGISMSRPITFVSRISYSVYLVHYGIVLQLMRYFYDITRASMIELGVFTAVYFAVTITLSTLLYKFYEKPMTDLRDHIG